MQITTNQQETHRFQIRLTMISHERHVLMRWEQKKKRVREGGKKKEKRKRSERERRFNLLKSHAVGTLLYKPNVRMLIFFSPHAPIPLPHPYKKKKGGYLFISDSCREL